MLARSVVTALVAAAICLARPVSAAEEVIDLAGEWQAHNSETKEKIGLGTIHQKGKELTFDNGTDKSKGEFVEKHKVKAFDWKLEAKVSPDGKLIEWSNGTYWVKKGK